MNLENCWASPNNSQVSKCPGTEVVPDCVKEVVSQRTVMESLFTWSVLFSLITHTHKINNKCRIWRWGMCISIEFFQQMWQGEKFFFVCHDWIPIIGWMTISRSPQAAFSHWHAAICQGLSQPRNRGWSQSTRAGKRDMKTKDLVETQWTSWPIMAHDSENLEHQNPIKSHQIPWFILFFHIFPSKIADLGKAPLPFLSFLGKSKWCSRRLYCDQHRGFWLAVSRRHSWWVAWR